MQLEPNDLLLFARVIEEGSFSRAAEKLGVPVSTASRRIAHLEQSLGERLLLRTTRKLTVTELGLAVAEHARHERSAIRGWVRRSAGRGRRRGLFGGVNVLVVWHGELASPLGEGRFPAGLPWR